MAFYGVPSGVTNPPRRPGQNLEPSPELEKRMAPGTAVLVAVFLAAFVVYYFVNWKLLSALWKIR